MIKGLLVATLTSVSACCIALASQFPGLPLDVFGLPVVLGGVAVLALIGLLFSDYSRKPSFRVRSPREPGTLPTFSAGADWTYMTRSA